jgi:phage tail sheath protein FI
MIGLRRWLRQHMSDMVFEPQTPLLWDRIRRRLFGHCLDLWRAGALAEGADEMDAFTVQCDSETNPLGSQERGQVIAKLSLAPSVPAEFIEVQIVHDASGFSVSAA